jgi:hypothetical protein
MISAFRYFKLEYSRLKLLECIEARAAMSQVMKRDCACIKSGPACPAIPIVKRRGRPGDDMGGSN